MERGHESTPLQEVMSPTHGPASGILNGTSSTVDNSLPNQTGELAGNGVQQATVMTSGPSTSAAVQMPSPLLPRDDRTGGDGTSGLVGSLGTTGAMYGSVSTTEVADASGVHGDVTAKAQGLGVATVQSGMASSQINATADNSGHNLPAAIPEGSTGSVGFETPRSSLQGAPVVIGAQTQAFAAQTFSGLMGRVQSLFTGPANVQAIPPTWMPSPLRQSPAMSTPKPVPPERESRHVETSPAPLFSGANLQQMAAVERRAPLLYGSPPQAPGANTESSSIPHDAIQAEVARQLAGLKQELENQRARADHAEALLRAQVADQQRSVNTQQVGLGSVSGFGMDYTGSMGDSAVGSGLPSVPQPIPPMPKAPSGPSPGVGFAQAKAPPPAVESQNLAGLLSGLIGGRNRSQSPSGQRPSAVPADAQPIGSHPSDRELLLASLAGMRQLQGVVADSMRGRDRDDSNSPTHAVAVKPGTTNFPVLAELTSNEGSLAYQDWLQTVTGLVGDVSDSASEWWAGVLNVVDRAYGVWISSSPIDRLRVEPTVPAELLRGRWVRVNFRVCSMLMTAIPEAIRADIVARKCNSSAPAILFRLHTLYQPGGGSEKALILKNLNEPVAAKDAASAVKLLRDWIRWHNRCVDCNMALPDTTVLSQGLTTITSQVLANNEEAKFRTFMLRAMLKMDAQPTSAAILEYHKHLLAEVEALSVAKATDLSLPKLRAVGAQNQPCNANTNNQTSKPLCKYFLGTGGCRRGAKCTYGHDMSSLSRQERSKKCLACGSEAHRQKDCPAVGNSPKKGQVQQGGGASPNKPSGGQAQVAQTQVPIAPDSSPSRAEDSLTAFMRHMQMLYGASGPATNVPSSSTSLVPAVPASVPSLPPTTSPTQALEDQSPSQDPSIKAIRLEAIEAEEEDGDTGVVPTMPGPRFQALCDSGATHALRSAASLVEWNSAQPVRVSLAGKETVDMRLSSSGTLLLPPTSDAQTIVPLGSVIQQLGYRLDWTSTRCRLIAPSGRVFRLRVKAGCPEIVESEALVLISKLEEKRSLELKALEANIDEGKSRIRTLKTNMSKGWFGHLEDYVSTGSVSSGHLAVKSAPFFADVPQASLQGLIEDAHGLSGWELLKGLTHLNRRARRALLKAPEWVVHLYAGGPGRKPFADLSSGDMAVLELDIRRGSGQDVMKSPAWRVLVWGAMYGKVSHVLGGPPCRTLSVLRPPPLGPPPVRGLMDLYGLPDLSPADRALVDHDTALFVRQIWLHALSTAGRKVRPPPKARLEIGFLLESPMLVDRYVAPSNPLFGEVPSFWNTGLWNLYADEAGLWETHINQGDLGHVAEKPTTLGNNYGDLQRLETVSESSWDSRPPSGESPCTSPTAEPKRRKPPYTGKSSDLAPHPCHRCSYPELVSMV